MRDSIKLLQLKFQAKRNKLTANEQIALDFYNIVKKKEGKKQALQAMKASLQEEIGKATPSKRGRPW